MNAWMHVIKRGMVLISNGSAGGHLHFVMNDPVLDPILNDYAVLTVCICSVRPTANVDYTCILQRGCGINFVQQDSFVDYRHAAVSRATPLEQDVKTGTLPSYGLAPANVFMQVRNGLYISPGATGNFKVQRFCKLHGI